MSKQLQPRRELGLSRTILALSIAAIGAATQSAAWAQAEDEEMRRLLRPTSEIELGLGHVSSDSFKFGDYTGLHRSGAHLIGNASVNLRGEDDTRYLNLSVRSLGLDSRNLNVEGGEQGNYGLRLEYDQIPKLWSDSYQTPFANPGSSSLTLPAGWVRTIPGVAAFGTTTTSMVAQINANMRPLDIETQRDSLGLGFSKQLPAGWDFDVRAKREKKDGNRLIAGVIGNSGGNPRAAILPEPIDYTTDEIEALVRYTQKKLQLQFGYYGSFFQNGNSALSWDNPFNNSVWGGVPANRGQLSLMPDNQFHQLSASGGYSITSDTRVSGSLSFGRMTQDDAFLPYTINSGLTVTRPLPRNSLDGRVDTTHADLKLTTKLMPKLHMTASYRYDDRDNKTPQAQYLYIGGDSMNQPATLNAGQARTNLPVSSTRQQIDAELDYNWTPATKLKFGYGYDWTEKTFEAIEKEKEHTVKAEVHQHFNDVLSGGFGYAYSDRDTSEYDASRPFIASFSSQYVASQFSAALPLNGQWDNLPTQYKFFLAPRQRDKVRGFLNVAPTERIDLQFGFDYKLDDYHKSQHGLQEAKGWAVNLDASFNATDALTANVFTSYDKYSTEQRSATGTTKVALINPVNDWTADMADRTVTVGAGFRYTPLRRYEFGADLVHAKSKGRIEVATAAAGPSAPLPDLSTRLSRLDMFGRYELKKDLSLKVKYIYERYKSSDWAYDQVTATTMANVIGTNEISPRYNVHFIGVSMAYKF